jgi:hypothetical protein
MGIRVEDIRLVHRVVGTKHVFTSPDVPELHISHADKQMAFENVQPALDLLDEMKQRIEARKRVRDQMRERAVA